MAGAPLLTRWRGVKDLWRNSTSEHGRMNSRASALGRTKTRKATTATSPISRIGPFIPSDAPTQARTPAPATAATATITASGADSDSGGCSLRTGSNSGDWAHNGVPRCLPCPNTTRPISARYRKQIVAPASSATSNIAPFTPSMAAATARVPAAMMAMASNSAESRRSGATGAGWPGAGREPAPSRAPGLSGRRWARPTTAATAATATTATATMPIMPCWPATTATTPASAPAPASTSPWATPRRPTGGATAVMTAPQTAPAGR